MARPAQCAGACALDRAPLGGPGAPAGRRRPARRHDLAGRRGPRTRPRHRARARLRLAVRRDRSGVRRVLRARASPRPPAGVRLGARLDRCLLESRRAGPVLRPLRRPHRRRAGRRQRRPVGAQPVRGVPADDRGRAAADLPDRAVPGGPLGPGRPGRAGADVPGRAAGHPRSGQRSRHRRRAPARREPRCRRDPDVHGLHRRGDPGHARRDGPRCPGLDGLRGRPLPPGRRRRTRPDAVAGLVGARDGGRARPLGVLRPHRRARRLHPGDRLPATGRHDDRHRPSAGGAGRRPAQRDRRVRAALGRPRRGRPGRGRACSTGCCATRWRSGRS